MMSQRVPSPQSLDVAERKQQLHQLLIDALNLVDALALPPEVGARLQEAIDLAERHLDTGDWGKEARQHS
jgi:hypothetical protein